MADSPTVHGREPADAESLLVSYGATATQVEFLLTYLLPQQFLIGRSLSEMTLLTRHALDYLVLTDIDRLCELGAQLSLVMPGFLDAAIAAQVGLALDGEAPDAATGPQRAVEIVVHAATLDLFLLGPSATPLGAHGSIPATVLLDEVVIADLVTHLEARGEEPPSTASAGPRTPREIASDAASLALFEEIDTHLRESEARIKAEHTDLHERQRQQRVLTTSHYVAYALSVGRGKSLNVQIELDDPPPVARRHLDDYPLLERTTTQVSDAIWIDRSDSAAVRRQWMRDMTIGNVDLLLWRHEGVIGILAAVAFVAIRSFKMRVRDAVG